MKTQNLNPNPLAESPSAGSNSEPSQPPTTPDSCSLSFGERAGVREDPLLTEGPVHSPQDATRKSVGKVAHLPKDIRRLVNEMLDDGATYNEIVAKLAELGHPGFFYQNIQRWKNGGYKQWLRAQEQREETIIMTETALELAQDDPNTAAHLCEANEILLALKNHKLLQEINDWDAETLLGTEKSKAYFQLSRSITHQLAQRTRRERFKFDVEWKKQKRDHPDDQGTARLYHRPGGRNPRYQTRPRRLRRRQY